jgi:hypothetical protein
MFQIEPTQQRIRVPESNYIIYPGFELALLQNDLALLNLPQSAIFNEFVQPIKLPNGDLLRKNFKNELAQTTGEIFFFKG